MTTATRSVRRAALADAVAVGATRVEHPTCPKHPAAVLLGAQRQCPWCTVFQAATPSRSARGDSAQADGGSAVSARSLLPVPSRPAPRARAPRVIELHTAPPFDAYSVAATAAPGVIVLVGRRGDAVCGACRTPGGQPHRRCSHIGAVRRFRAALARLPLARAS